MTNYLEIPEVDPCAFCDYLSGARAYVFLCRNAEVAIAVTREQRGRSHLIVFPVEHHHTLLDLPDRLAGPLMRAVRVAATAIASAEKSAGIAVWQNNGLAAAQTIPHIHFHVAGTLPGGGTDFGDVPEISLDSARAIADRLSPHVGCSDSAA
ncbi:HIT family protein [Microbacterium aquilitoris]|uniref:HIT family protein n=1 Tax=Microbacterium aquilitoris TaxID=3067307 RepID=UPI00288F8145|nr:HIT domain-containing protein [Microbacterium sp. KSW2-22]MDT3344466.1 HIT domain-containing protein [Microbacterium sp. KSW2-22]